MLKTRIDLARNVAAELIAIENHVDGALICNANLQSVIIAGRRNAKLPLHTGQESIEQLANATAALIAARKAIHEAHNQLRQVQDDIGLPTISYGDYGDTPRDPGERRENGHLAIVHAA